MLNISIALYDSVKAYHMYPYAQVDQELLLCIIKVSMVCFPFVAKRVVPAE